MKVKTILVPGVPWPEKEQVFPKLPIKVARKCRADVHKMIEHIRANPDATLRKICDATKVDYETAVSALDRLRKAGVLKGEKRVGGLRNQLVYYYRIANE